MAKKTKKTKKIVRGPKHSKKEEVEYRRVLLELVTKMADDIKALINPILFRYENDYVVDGYAGELSQAFESLENFYGNLGPQVKTVASTFVGKTDSANKDRFYKAINKAVGVDVGSIVQNEGLTEQLTSATRRNVSLIKSIPNEHFKALETMVFNGVNGGEKPGGIIKQITELTGVSKKRARVIARDQSSKLNSELTMQRQLNLGVEEYRWQTAEDGNRVRETHRANNGKIFRWDDPPKETGHPGDDIQCRCIAQPIIDVSTIRGVPA